MKALLAFCLLMLACETPEEERLRNRSDFERQRDFIEDNLRFFRDDRTGLCFAAMNLGSPFGTLTNVTCTPDVMQFANHFRSKDTVLK